MTTRPTFAVLGAFAAAGAAVGAAAGAAARACCGFAVACLYKHGAINGSEAL